MKALKSTFRVRCLSGVIATVSMSGLLTESGWALDGSNNVVLTVPTGINTGWKTFELLSGNDALEGRAKEGFVWTSKHDDWDGLGAYRHDVTTLRVFINHEAGSNSTFSRVDLDVENLRTWMANGNANNNNSNQVSAPGIIVTDVSRGWLTPGAVSLGGYEVWKVGYPNLSPAELLPTADPDGDGVLNVEEFASNLDPTTKDAAVLVAGSGGAGLALVEIRNVSGGERLVIEYVRRLGAGDLVYTPLFGVDLAAWESWATGATETVTPIDGYFERVVCEDAVLVGADPVRFGLLRMVVLAP